MDGVTTFVPGGSHLHRLGDFDFSRRDGQLWVEHASPLVVIGLELLDLIVCGECRPEVTIRHPDDLTPDWAGSVIRIEAANRTLLYRLTGYSAEHFGWFAEWPDLRSLLRQGPGTAQRVPRPPPRAFPVTPSGCYEG